MQTKKLGEASKVGASTRTTAALKDKVEVRESPIHGRGVFAKKRIRAKSLVGVYEGAPTKQNGRYVLWVEYEDGEVVGIDGTNELRYLNHSQSANAEFWGDELYALRTIEPGTEITFDYGDDWKNVP